MPMPGVTMLPTHLPESIGAEVREPSVGVVGEVVDARYVGAGDNLLEISLDVDEAKLSARIRELLRAGSW